MSQNLLLLKVIEARLISCNFKMSSIEIFKRRIHLPSAMPAGFHSPPETLRDPLMKEKSIVYYT